MIRNVAFLSVLKTLCRVTVLMCVCCFIFAKTIYGQCLPVQINILGGNGEGAFTAIVQITDPNDPVNGLITLQATSYRADGGQGGIPFSGVPGSITGSAIITVGVGNRDNIGGVMITITNSCCETTTLTLVNFSTPRGGIRGSVKYIGNTCGGSPIKFEFVDGMQVPDPFRIGITSKTNKRTVKLRAVIQPGSDIQAKDVDIVINPIKSKVIKISPPRITDNIINFEVDGQIDTIASIPTSIDAKHKSMGVLATLPVRVVIPYQVDSEHDTDGINGLESANLAINETTSPADVNVKKEFAFLVTYYERFLRVKILDQYGDSIGSLYEGSAVLESEDGKKFLPINQRMRSDSIFLDPVGIIVGDPDAMKVRADSPEALAWPNKDKIKPAVDADQTSTPQNLSLKIDEFEIPLNRAIKNRTIRVILNNGNVAITVMWP